MVSLSETIITSIQVRCGLSVSRLRDAARAQASRFTFFAASTLPRTSCSGCGGNYLHSLEALPAACSGHLCTPSP